MAFPRWRATLSSFKGSRAHSISTNRPFLGRPTWRNMAFACGGGGVLLFSLYLVDNMDRTPEFSLRFLNRPYSPELVNRTIESVKSGTINYNLAAATKFLTLESYQDSTANQVFRKSKGFFPTVHAVRVASNSPVEDELVAATAPGTGSRPWKFWGVFDGHAGFMTSTVLKEALVSYVSRELSELPETSVSFAITAGIKKAFLNLDADILRKAEDAVHRNRFVSAEAILALAPAISGSCALLAIFDERTSILRTACTGDSRAVLGRYDEATGKYIAMPLSVDQTGFNESERQRVEAAHPGESSVIDPKSGRLLGLAVTRAFGDARWKWPDIFTKRTQEKFWGYAPRPNTLTPPYLTAEPVVTETQVVTGERGDFLILASDGLWDHISSEDAVTCVGLWKESKARGQGKIANDPEREKHQVDSPDDGHWLDEGKYVEFKATPQYFVVEDENAAVHLVRNAFGGSRRRLFCAVMSTLPPLSRNVRDDATVQVIFFDKAPN
ncbi:protein serine/threonine phosphatase 2C [Lepidopterella palustris CBS 459.81]|uniref:Protein serine/threonine phosphatase 2C n=1 Tax=Lepidopterella palustris CBS 459.81 TaxID=1314670 RepID=A0A8E2J8I9_9PEZI|nr:protein serine/threonine phosphatase 2C [Lepidopterella palustris CBS 459.81]